MYHASGTRAHRPSIAGFEDTGKVAGQAIEVIKGRRVGGGETRLRADDVLVILIEAKLAEGRDGRGKQILEFGRIHPGLTWAAQHVMVDNLL